MPLWQSILLYMAIKYGKPIQDRSIFVKAFYNTFPKNSGLILMTILFLLVTKYTIVSRRKVVKSKLSMHRTEVFLLSLPTTRFASLITFFLLFIQKSNLSIKLYLKCYLRLLFLFSLVIEDNKSTLMNI